ncbi:hypothetical protein BD289DRAFT_32033 [Coniella lustricola]|uniref:Secreted protein n=1 Tax=Coniella lustricola TaxID=2025994 RepID=A0A2T3A2P7_9PEZI|nr:hypothetical protein BD289DRAFT_32033 [Coniella lustricola]
MRQWLRLSHCLHVSAAVVDTALTWTEMAAAIWVIQLGLALSRSSLYVVLTAQTTHACFVYYDGQVTSRVCTHRKKSAHIHMLRHASKLNWTPASAACVHTICVYRYIHTC